MTDRAPLRRLLDRTENIEFPLHALEAVRDLRKHLSDVEREALHAARTRGASVHDIADALGITRQAVYYKLSQLGGTGSERAAADDVIQVPEVEPATPDLPSGRKPAPTTHGPPPGSAAPGTTANAPQTVRERDQTL